MRRTLTCVVATRALRVGKSPLTARRQRHRRGPFPRPTSRGRLDGAGMRCASKTVGQARHVES